ncbi:uncharacterized protein LOC141876628 isoform X1 [Acropora palmata]|uniref:uncharacterized protein LOC141876628 isoform X1 n=1 Tax=Acropora palmata TaxID=6131 RepID=UPI003DA09EA0
MMMPPSNLPWGSSNGILPYCEILIERRHEKFIVFSAIHSNAGRGEKLSPCLSRIILLRPCVEGMTTVCKRNLEEPLQFACKQSANNWHKRLRGSSKLPENSSDNPSAWNDEVNQTTRRGAKEGEESASKPKNERSMLSWQHISPNELRKILGPKRKRRLFHFEESDDSEEEDEMTMKKLAGEKTEGNKSNNN